MYDKRNLAVRHAASEDATRSNINGIRCEEGRTIATDGRMIAIIDVPDKKDAPGVEVNLSQSGLKAVVHAQRPVRKIMKGSRKGTYPTFAVEARADEYLLNYEGVAVSMKVKSGVEGDTFPNYKQCIPTVAPTFKITIGTPILRKIADICKDADIEALTFKFTDEYSPVRAEAWGGVGDDSSREALIVFMPMRPEWKREAR